MSIRKTQNAEQLAARRVRALSLRLSGASYREIAAELDVSLRRAYLDVQQELAILDPITKATAERLRELGVARLDRWLLQLSERIDPPANHPPVSDRALVSLVTTAVNVTARRARLLGLDAPTKVAQTDASGQDVPMVRLSQQELDMRLKALQALAEEARQRSSGSESEEKVH